MAVKLQRKLLNTEAYHLMRQAGIFSEDDRVELIKGELIQKSPIESPHAAHVKRIRTLLGELLGRKVVIGVQDPVILDDYSEPEPDISVLKPEPAYYASRHPGPEDILFIIEVADSSLEVDREVKAPLYAAAGIPVYWLVNLIDQQIEVYSHPDEGMYKQREIATRKDSLFVDSLGLEVAVKEML